MNLKTGFVIYGDKPQCSLYDRHADTIRTTSTSVSQNLFCIMFNL